jgi:hypothetical protein
MNYSLVAGIHSKEKVVNFYFDGLLGITDHTNFLRMKSGWYTAPWGYRGIDDNGEAKSGLLIIEVKDV